MIGRPQQNEAAEYYWRYIDQAPGEDPISLMEDQLHETNEFLHAIGSDQSSFRYAEGKWSIRQLLNHVTDTERAFVFRALWFSRGFESPLPSYDQEIAAAGAQADTVEWFDHVEEFLAVRRATLAFFRNLSRDGWQRSGIASDKRFTVRALAFIIPGHVEHHLRILRERYLAATAIGS
jgi:hypothetical protein